MFAGKDGVLWMAGSAYVYANPVLMDHRPTISGRPNPRWVMRRISSNAVSWFGALIRSRQKVRPLLTIALRLAPTMPAEVSWVSARLAFSWLVKLATCTRMLSRVVVAVTLEVCAESVSVRVSLVVSLGGVVSEAFVVVMVGDLGCRVAMVVGDPIGVRAATVGALLVVVAGD